MGYGLLADLIVAIHVAFVLFVVAGGLFVLRWPKVAWAHVPAALWGIWIEWAGWICPLTPLENRLRLLAGEPSFTTDFVARYLLPVLYPAGLTRSTQIALGTIVLVFNLAIYALVWRRARTGGRV